MSNESTVAKKKCVGCGIEIPEITRKDRRYCSVQCYRAQTKVTLKGDDPQDIVEIKATHLLIGLAFLNFICIAGIYYLIRTEHRRSFSYNYNFLVDSNEFEKIEEEKAEDEIINTNTVDFKQT